MKPTVKVYLKPKYKIGDCAWTLKCSMFDYFQNPTDDKLSARKVVGYTIHVWKGKHFISAYHFQDGGSETGAHNWDFVSKKAIKEYLQQKAIENYRFGSSYSKPKIEKFHLTHEERKLLNLL